jgi:hypothetical protein
LCHESVSYEGIRRPIEVLRAMDSPAADPGPRKAHHQKMLEQYFYDLYGVFMKKLSAFVLESSFSAPESVALQAMLQEMVKVKKLMSR